MSAPQILLEFGHSRSPRYAHAVRLAAAQPGYACAGEEREAVHRVPITPRTFTVLDDLLPLVAGWKTTRVRLDGITVPAGAFWLGSILACHQQRRLTGLGDLHCRDVPHGRSGLPCRQLSGVALRRRDLDADTVIQLVEGEARSRLIVACPAWNPDALAEAIRVHRGEPQPEERDDRVLDQIVGDIDLDALDRPEICPDCGAHDVKTLLSGYPTEATERAIDAGWAVGGGCMGPDERWICGACEAAWS